MDSKSTLAKQLRDSRPVLHRRRRQSPRVSEVHWC